jgi:hypothetical protein
LSKQKLFIVLFFIAIIAGVGVASAITYYLTPSSPVTVTVSSGLSAVPITLTSNGTSITDLDTLTLTVVPANIHGNGLTVYFYDNGTQVGTTQTITSGYASITLSSLAVGTHVFTATPSP